jgi:hypothetical protein
VRARTEIEFQPIEVKYDLSRSDVENLLAGFLTGAQGIELGTRLTDIRELPETCRTLVRRAEESGRAWTAWSTPIGPVAAWGQYDLERSRQLFAFLLLVEWWDVPSGHHALWAYCDPRRPTEWTIGHGRHRESP